jgi:low affinity Fe/Cu permease
MTRRLSADRRQRGTFCAAWRLVVQVGFEGRRSPAVWRMKGQHDKHPNNGHSRFQHFAVRTADLVGSWQAFQLALACLVGWAVLGPMFDFSDTWQLWINTGTTIVTFLMVFLIQYTQNRDARAMHLKVDELLRAVQGARTEMADLKDLTDDELRQMELAFQRLARAAARTRLSGAAVPPASHDPPR